jgi:serine/threonine protein kinase
MPDLIGKTIEQYQIVAQLSQERWGELYKAYDAKFDRTVSLHVLDQSWAAQGEQGEYALQTTRAALRFRHPGISRVYDFGTSDELTYIVTEFIPGSSLEQILDKMRDSSPGVGLHPPTRVGTWRSATRTGKPTH